MCCFWTVVFFMLPSPYCHLAYFSCFDLRIPLLGHCDHSGAIHPDCRFPHWGTAYFPRARSWCSHHQVQRQLSSGPEVAGVGDWGRTMRMNYLVILWCYLCTYTYIDNINIYIYIRKNVYIYTKIHLYTVLEMFFTWIARKKIFWVTKWCQMTESQYGT